MLKLAEKDSPGTRKLVLGFDAECMSCSQLAERIEEAVGEKLETVSLSDHRMTEWRRQALGEDAPWAPTLVEIRDGEVKAWTGAMMGAHLARSLGPAATWRVAKILGEMKENNRAEHSPYSGLTRSQFLKGLGGAVIGVSVLSGTGSLAAPAAAEEEHWLSQLSIASSKELSRKQAAVAWARLARGRHLLRLFSARIMDENSAAGRIRGRILSAVRTRGASPSTANIKGIRHQLEGGGRLLTLVYQEDDALIVSYRLDKRGQKTRLFSQVIEDESEDTVRILATADGGDVLAPLQGAAPQGELTTTARRRCWRQRQCPGACNVCRCASYNKRCMFNCCAWCGFPCRWGTWWACLACILVYCPICASVNRCCYYKTCQWRQACA